MTVINTMVKTDSSDPTTSSTPSMEHLILLRHSRSTKQYSPSTERLLPQIARMYTWELKCSNFSNRNSCAVNVNSLTDTRRSDIDRFNIKSVFTIVFFFVVLLRVKDLNARAIRKITTEFPPRAPKPIISSR